MRTLGRFAVNLHPWIILGCFVGLSLATYVSRAEPPVAPLPIVAADENLSGRESSANAPRVPQSLGHRFKTSPTPPPAPSIIDPANRPIDLNTAASVGGSPEPRSPDCPTAGRRGRRASATCRGPVLALAQPRDELRHAYRCRAAVQRKYPLGQSLVRLRGSRDERGGGRDGEYPWRRLDGQRGHRGLRLLGLEASCSTT